MSRGKCPTGAITIGKLRKNGNENNFSARFFTDSFALDSSTLGTVVKRIKLYNKLIANVI